MPTNLERLAELEALRAAGGGATLELRGTIQVNGRPLPPSVANALLQGLRSEYLAALDATIAALKPSVVAELDLEITQKESSLTNLRAKRQELTP